MCKLAVEGSEEWNAVRLFKPTWAELKREERRQPERSPHEHRWAMREEHRKLKAQVYDHYGNECACPGCWEDDPMFLNIDHVNNDGNVERALGLKGRVLLRHIVAMGFPDYYQILCCNCNIGKHRNGGVCPHMKRIRKSE